MKRVLMVVVGLLTLVLLLYVALGCLVYFYYEPNIEREATRQDGWNRAIAEIEEECQRLRAVQGKDLAAQKRQRDRLQQSVKEAADRHSRLQRDLKGSAGWSAAWREKSAERLALAQQALDEFKGSKGNAEMEAKIMFLRQQIEALRIRQDRINHLIEWRDMLSIWPLPLLDRLVKEKKTTEE